jgi:hypothetical protein
MATGIVSIGADDLGLTGVAVALYVVNIAAYVVLWTLSALRLAKHRGARSSATSSTTSAHSASSRSWLAPAHWDQP